MSDETEGTRFADILDQSRMDEGSLADVVRYLLSYYDELTDDDESEIDITNLTIDTESIKSHAYLKNMVCREQDSADAMEEYFNDSSPPPFALGSLQAGQFLLLNRIQPFPGLHIPYFTTSQDEVDLLLQYAHNAPNLPILCVLGGDLDSFDMNIRLGCSVHVQYGALRREESGVRLGVVLVCDQPCETVRITHSLDIVVSGSVRVTGSAEPSTIALPCCAVKRTTRMGSRLRSLLSRAAVELQEILSAPSLLRGVDSGDISEDSSQLQFVLCRVVDALLRRTLWTTLRFSLFSQQTLRH